jgi:GT2 family glycosyltransferase
MKLSIVIICWNDRKVIFDCLKSIVEETKETEFEVVISDNGSTDGSIGLIREQYPACRIVENCANLGFARGNNAGIRHATGEYVLILNPDTIVRDRALDKWVAYAERHPEAGAFGCRVLNPDGSFQNPARPFPTVWRLWVAALWLRPLGHISNAFVADLYPGWAGETDRPIDWQSGCCVMVRRELLHRLEGFDERFFYHYEEVDLCLRVWRSGKPVLFYAGAEITHLGGQSVGRFPIRFALEKLRNRYRYIGKHDGDAAMRACRRATHAGLWLRRAGYGLRAFFGRTEALTNRLEMYRICIAWNARLDPVAFCRYGTEPDLGYAPLTPAPVAAAVPAQ